MSKRGRPTKYSDPVREKILQLLKEGKTEAEVAQVIGVDPKTISNWKGQHVDLFHAVNESKLLADEMVELALFRKATGYEHPEDKFIVTKIGDVIPVESTKRYPPDTTAIMFWLRNRQPEKWREKNESDVTVNNTIQAGSLSDEELNARIQAMLEKARAPEGQAE